MSPADLLLKEHYKTAKNKSEEKIIDDLLVDNNLTKTQWISFIDLVNDLDLNKKGAKILLDELKNGKVTLPCDQ